MSERTIQLNPNRMKRAETLRTLYAVNAEHGTDREDLLKPDYWCHIAAKLTPLDRLEVRADDGTWWAEYLVISCDRTWAKVKELRWLELSNVAADDSDLSELEYKWRGPQAKHSVVRKSDQSVMAEKLNTKDEALVWIANYNRNQAA